MITFLGFNKTQQLVILPLAISFWMSGVFLVRLLSSYGLWGGWSGAVIFALSIPAAAISIRGVQMLLRLTPSEVLPTVALITALVAMLHGVAITYVASLYRAQGPELILASAWLVWFVGAVLISLLLMKRQ